jgi:hypothetical protein
VDFFFTRGTLPISGEQIVGPIVLAQHKRNERIGEVRITVRSASPIVIEITFYFAVLTGNGNMFNTR